MNRAAVGGGALGHTSDDYMVIPRRSESHTGSVSQRPDGSSKRDKDLHETLDGLIEELLTMLSTLEDPSNDPREVVGNSLVGLERVEEFFLALAAAGVPIPLADIYTNSSPKALVDTRAGLRGLIGDY